MIRWFDEPRNFEFPVLQNRNVVLRNILQRRAGDKYTLSDKLWNYLQEYHLKHKLKGNGFGFGLVDRDGYSRTLSARYHKDGSEILIKQPGKNPRRLTPRECARLMGFPDSFKVPALDSWAYRQFGNSVVVPVVQRIAKSMLECMTNPSKRITLSDYV